MALLTHLLRLTWLTRTGWSGGNGAVPAVPDHLLLESGESLLLESGDYILLEAD